MNRVAKIAIVSAFSSLALAGVSRAESLGMNTAPGIEQTLRSFQGDFAVQPYHDWRNIDSVDQYGPRSAPERDPREVRQIQASIDANKSLVHKLSDQGVRVNNVVNAEQAADGSITIFTD